MERLLPKRRIVVRRNQPLPSAKTGVMATQLHAQSCVPTLAPTREPVTRTSKVYGYVSASLTGEDRTKERASLKASGCLIVLSELDALLEDMDAGDMLMTMRLASLARSNVELRDAVQKVDAKGVTLKVMQPSIQTSTASGKAFIEMLDIFADFEANVRKGRPSPGASKPAIDPSKVSELQEKGLGATAIARELNIARASVYRLMVGEK